MTNIHELRQTIDTIDSDIVMLMAKRFQIVREVGKIKKEQKKDILQADRKKQVAQHYLDGAKKHNFSPDFAHELYELIHKYAVEEESKQ